MAEKSIVWSRRAHQEVLQILAFYNNRNKSSVYSDKLFGELEEVLKSISKNAFLRRLANNKTTRLFPFGNFIIFYEIYEDEILFASFWDNRQNESKRGY